MTALDDQVEIHSRPVAARLGIVALNLIMPGLGLLRLNRRSAAAAFIVVQWLGLVVLYLRFKSGAVFTFGTWFAFVIPAIVVTVLIYAVSLLSTWRASHWLETRRGWVWRWYGLVLVWAIVTAISAPIGDFRVFYRTFSLKSGSMLPTLQANDLVLAGTNLGAPIQRGDLIVVHKDAVDYIKRIVAIPGDRVALVDGRVVLNGMTVAQRKLGMTQATDSDGTRPATVLEERLPGEAKPHRVLDLGQTPQDNWPGALLGADQYVVLGDNRDNSLDSRFPVFAGGFGLVSRSQIMARILFRYYRSGEGFGNGML